jgi:high-affinity Fe2+/Pb2+ permease
MLSLLTRSTAGLASLAWPLAALLALLLAWAFVWWFSRLPIRRQRAVERLVALAFGRRPAPRDGDP